MFLERFGDTLDMTIGSTDIELLRGLSVFFSAHNAEREDFAIVYLRDSRKLYDYTNSWPRSSADQAFGLSCGYFRA